MERKPLIVFLHIRKTAGSTLRDHIARNLAPRQYLLSHGSQLSADESFRRYWQRLLANYSPAELDELLLIGGHYIYYGVDEFFPGREIYYVTEFRRPDKLIVSYYNFLVDDIKEKKNLHLKKNYLDLLDPDGRIKNFERALTETGLFDDLLFRSFYDFVHDKFSVNFPEQLDGQLDKEQLLREFAPILKRFHFIGTDATMDNDLHYLYSLLDIRKFFPPVNKSRPVVSLSALPPETVRLIADKTSWDWRLFEAAREAGNNLSRPEYLAAARQSQSRKKLYCRRYFFHYHLLRPYEALGRMSAALRKKSAHYGRLIDWLKNRL